MRDPTPLNHTNIATLFDALSLAVAYPGEALIEAWRSGDFLDIVAGTLGQIGETAALRQAHAELAAGIRAYMNAERRAVDVQADYVALFELNRDRAPIHLYQHLYEHPSKMSSKMSSKMPSKTPQLELYRQLTELYRAHGIALKQGEGTLPPDQLSVQVEFLAYLCQRLAQTPPGADADRLRETVHDFAAALRWIDAPIERLAQTDPHPLYLPLLRFLRGALDLFAA